MSTSAPKLSFCIATFNRARFLGETLTAIIAQATTDCEIIVSDNASTDDTEKVVLEYKSRFSRLRYVRQHTNKGLDRNFDCSVEHAEGEYCWLMSDDDLLKPGAVVRVLDALNKDLSVVIVNLELRDLSMSKVVLSRWIDFESDRRYGPEEMDQLFIDLDHTLMNIGNIIVKREIWMSRDRERYYGTLFVHVGVLFQKPLPGESLIIAAPLINYRSGNVQTFSSRWTEIYLHKWPSLIDSLAISSSSRKRIRSARLWTSLPWLLFLRGLGYSMIDYRRWIRPRLSAAHERYLPILVAVLPRVLANPINKFYHFVNQSVRRLLRLTGQIRRKRLANRILPS